MSRKSNEEFVAEVKALVGDEYTFLEDYKNAKTKILCRHNKCGYEWMISPTNFLTGKRCPSCQKKIKYTLEDAKRIFSSKGLTLLAEEYIDANTNMPFICQKHKDKGVQYRTLSVINNTDTPGCKYCGYERSSQKQINKELYPEMKQCFLEHGLELLEDEYKGVHHWYLCKCIKHPEHGQFYKRYVDVKSQNQGCPKCGHENLRASRRKTEEYYKQLVEDSGYIFVGVEYNHRSIGHTNVYYICPKHRKYGIQVKAAGKIKTSGCPYCSNSKGELLISKYLSDNNIMYTPHFWFDDLRGTGGLPLSYDFYLPDYNLLIEFQGIQHEKPIDIFGGDEQFKTQVEHDRRKREYAKLHNYVLLEVWHNEIEEIEEVLFSNLNKYKVVS